MKSEIKVRQNRSAARPAPQAKTPAEFKVVRLRECAVDSPQIENPPQVVDFWRKQVVSATWFKAEKECLCVFLLNAHHKLLGFELVGHGTLDTVLMHPREVLRLATVQNAKAIIIAHNHPSGDPCPSDADINATRELIRAAALLKIELLDHVIIGDVRRKNGYTSLKGLGVFDTAMLPSKTVRDVRDAAEEVNQATVQSNVLLELIENHLDHREHRSGADFTGARADEFNFGLSMLAQQTRERLKKAAADIMDAAFPKRAEVAS
jgi:DNA repair protein RadC